LINRGREQYTVTADYGQFDSGVLEPGYTFVAIVEVSGKLAYHCFVHRDEEHHRRGQREVTAARLPQPKKPAPDGATNVQE